MSSPLYQQVQALMASRISPLNARSLLQQALTRTGLSEALRREQVPALAAALAPGTRLFLGDGADELLKNIQALGGDVAARAPVRCDVLVEADIATARHAAHAECQHLGANAFATQRVITMVSELARNIVSYSHGGVIEVVPGDKRLAIIAQDRGPGINNVDEILSGTYRSKTGLGKGILGVKRLSTSFQLVTGPEGTRVDAEVRL